MAKKQNQKLKILYLYKILNEKTDENFPMNASQLIAELSKFGISAERKSIYDDIEALRLFGADINVSEENGRGYYIGERHFQTSEIKMLIDIIQAAKFISESKSMKLIEKIRMLAPVSDRNALKRQIVIANRVKSSNESVYYNVDNLYRGIDEKKVVRFRYHTWDIRKNKLYRNKGQFYYVNPIALMWAEEKYYLVAYDDFVGKLKHYRVDKMESVEVCDESISDASKNVVFDEAEYSKRSFNMFSGNSRNVKLRCKKDAAGIIFDRFGKDVFAVPLDDGDFTISVDISVSPQFYSWVFGVSDLVTILEPADVAKDLAKMCEETAAKYRDAK